MIQPRVGAEADDRPALADVVEAGRLGRLGCFDDRLELLERQRGGDREVEERRKAAVPGAREVIAQDDVIAGGDLEPPEGDRHRQMVGGHT